MMAPEKHRKIQFILSSDPSQETQRQARIHAARVAHARKNRFRVIEYQPSNYRREKPGAQRRKPESESDERKKADEEAQKLVLPGPLAQLASSVIAGSARSFNEVERFLFCYYAQVIIPAQAYHCHLMWNGAQYCDLMSKEWTPLTVSRLDALDSLFLLACRHLSLAPQQLPERKEYYLQLATKYKLSCMRALNESISAEVSALIKNETISTVVMLGFEEILAGDLAMSKHHALGALKMVRHNGGGKTMGLDGFLEYIVYKLWGDVRHVSAADILVDA